MTTGCTAGGASACLGLGASEPAAAISKPPGFIMPRVPSPLEAGEIPTRSPKPALATVPRTPFPPPVPLPYPRPGRRAGPPERAILAGVLGLLTTAGHLGS